MTGTPPVWDGLLHSRFTEVSINTLPLYSRPEGGSGGPEHTDFGTDIGILVNTSTAESGI